jgi:predicted acyl esterase
VEVETVGPAPLDPRAQQEMVPMRDGVRLATDVYLPSGSGPFPAVLVRLPYDKNGRYTWMPFLASHFIARGYAFLPQDVRGKFRSEGEPLAFVNEVPDGYDAIDWITRQPWSNGDVGMWGDSYYGFTQWAAVASRHPALKAIVPRATIAGIDSWLEGVTPLYGAHYLAEYWTDRNTNHWAPDWSQRPLAEVFDRAFEAIGRRSASFDYVLDRARGGARAALFPSAHPFEVLRIPTLHGVGWFDNITPPHMLDYEALMRNPAMAPYQYLHADSTDHENYELESVPIPESSGISCPRRSSTRSRRSTSTRTSGRSSRARDVLTFTTPQWDEPVTLAGRVSAHLDVWSDARSMFLHVKLVDVHEDGRAHTLLFGQRVVTERVARLPTEVYLGHTAYRVPAGHRLRLQIASSDFPVFLPHPGTDENPWDAMETRTNRQTLATGCEAPSYVSLTVIPSAR